MKRATLAHVIIVFLALVRPSMALEGLGQDNPTGVTGEYNGSSMIAGQVDPYTGNAKREVNDLTVTGSVGAYPLKWTRTLNTRGISTQFGDGGSWRHSYQWSLFIWPPPVCGQVQTPDATVGYPSGETRNFKRELNPTPHYVDFNDLAYEPIPDKLVEAPGVLGGYDLNLADGGKVEFRPLNGGGTWATAIVDPYGLRTTLGYEQTSPPIAQGFHLKTVTEPAGRSLEITYQNYQWAPNPNPPLTPTWVELIKQVQSFAWQGQSIEKAVYWYTDAPAVIEGQSIIFHNLTSVDYDDESHAQYEYYEPKPLHEGDWMHPLASRVKICRDVRFAGPMKNIKYEYASLSQGWCTVALGQVWKEKNASTDQALCTISYPTAPNCNYPAPTSFWHRTETRPDGAKREFQYSNDGAGELLNYTDFARPGASPAETPHTTTISFTPAPGNPNNYWRVVTDPLLHSTAQEKEHNIGAVVALIHADGEKVQYGYTDPAEPHYLASRIDENLNPPTSYTRNPSTHEIVRIDYPDGGSEAFENFTIFKQWKNHRMTNDHWEYANYNSRGLKTFSWTDEPNSALHSTKYIYYGNENNRPDRIDRIKTITDPNDNTTTYDYNKRGQITSITYADGSHIENEYYEYATDGTKCGALKQVKDELEHLTKYEYDEYHRVTKVTKVVNGVDQSTINDYTPPSIGGWQGYEALSHTTGSVYRVTTATAKVTENNYDSNFRLTRTTVAPGVQGVEAATRCEYDEVGRLKYKWDPRQNLTTYGYDESNQLTSVRLQGAQDALDETTYYEYDPVGNKTKEIRPDGAFRMWEYDAMNRLWHSIDWRLSTSDPETFRMTIYDNDFAGNVHTITDTKGAVYAYEYDERNRKISTLYPPDKYGRELSEGWHYDLAGNLEWHTNTAGKTKKFDYDERNRVIESWWDEPVPVGPHVVVRYDDAGRVFRILANGVHAGNGANAPIPQPDEISAETMVTFGYDDANRKLWEEQLLNGQPVRRVTSELNADGTRHTLQIVNPTIPGAPEPGGIAVMSPELPDSGTYSIVYDYTARNQLWTIGDASGAWQFEYAYDLSGNMTDRVAWSHDGQDSSTHCPNWGYDARNRPTRWEQTGANGTFWVADYHYDAAGREDWVFRHIPALSDFFSYLPNNQIDTAWYDALAPGVSVWRNVSYTYSPDRLNRVGMTEHVNDQWVSTVYSGHSDINQIGSYQEIGSSPVDCAYDDNFNLTSGLGFAATYDAENHLIRIANSQDEIDFTYDGLGRCVKQTTNGYDTVFLFDDWKPVAEWDVFANYFQAWNVYGPGQDEILLRQKSKYGYTRFHPDPHGNVEFLVDNDGQVVEHYTYDIFGTPKVEDWGGSNPPRNWSYYGHRFLFQGREYFDKFGVYDYRRRFYYPEMGYFLQADPIGIQIGGAKLTAMQKALFSPGGQAPEAFGDSEANLYRYCHNDPVNKTDPTGLEVNGTFDRGTGTLTLVDVQTGRTVVVNNVFSGNGIFTNNAALQHVKDHGPIAAGTYLIGTGADRRDHVPTGDAKWYPLYGDNGKGGYSYQHVPVLDPKTGKTVDRGGANIHTGSRSDGCVTIPSDVPEGDKNYPSSKDFNRVKDLLDNTKKLDYKGQEFTGKLKVK